MDRRDFLKQAAVFSTASMAPEFLVRAAEALARYRRLVVLELAGGFDGLNTVVPYTNSEYYAARPTLAIPADKVLRINDTVGFHPALAPLRALYDDGHLAIVQGVGYPNPSRCHARARSNWYAGKVHARDQRTMEPPLALGCNDARPDQDVPFSVALRGVIETIRADSRVSIFHVRMNGFDTHSNQALIGDNVRGAHAHLLTRFASGIKAFWDDVRALHKEREVLVMTVSEFGRRVRENASAGTDHGTANPMFFIGADLNPGFHGRHPGLSDDETDLVGDMIHTVDFRSVYSTVLARWLGVNPVPVIGGGGEGWDLLDFV